MTIEEATEQDLKRLLARREKKELADIQQKLPLQSLHDAEERMKETTFALDRALTILTDTYLSYDEDEDVDFETRLNHTRSLENIEHNYDVLAKIWECQCKRVAYEIKDATK